MIRNITKADISTIARLVNDESLLHKDVCYEHSLISIKENGMINMAIVLEKSSLIDYFDGMIPSDMSINSKTEVDYYEGEEYSIREDIEYYFKDNQYKVVCWYLEDTYQTEELKLLYRRATNFINGGIGAIWIPYDDNIPLCKWLYNLNNEVLVDIPIID